MDSGACRRPVTPSWIPALCCTQMDANLQAVHRIQREDAEKEQAQQGGIAESILQAAQQPGDDGAASRGFLELLASWAGGARRSVGSVVASLQAAFFNYCRQGEPVTRRQQPALLPPAACLRSTSSRPAMRAHAVLEATPSTHWRMRVLSALATSRLVRHALLSFYASASGASTWLGTWLLLSCIQLTAWRQAGVRLQVRAWARVYSLRGQHRCTRLEAPAGAHPPPLPTLQTTRVAWCPCRPTPSLARPLLGRSTRSACVGCAAACAWAQLVLAERQACRGLVAAALAPPARSWGGRNNWPCPRCLHAAQSAGGDLASVVTALKARHGLQYVYAWHAMAGFWGGLGLEDPEMAKYKARRACAQPRAAPAVAPLPLQSRTRTLPA